MSRRFIVVAAAVVAGLGLSAVALGAESDSYEGKLTSAGQSKSFMGATVVLKGNDVPKTITIGFSNATVPCGDAFPQSGQVGNISGAKVKKKGKKFTFKGTGQQGPGTSTIEGTISANGKKITGTVDHSFKLGTVTCSFNNEPYTLKFVGSDKPEEDEND